MAKVSELPITLFPYRVDTSCVKKRNITFKNTKIICVLAGTQKQRTFHSKNVNVAEINDSSCKIVLQNPPPLMVQNFLVPYCS